ncbi:transposase family protein [Streptomyces inhibens]|uniref:transposase family protein n=1 Tax=Streptomyces inhibens TaxID=2293571 RepID=UPI003159E7DA
MRRPQAGRPGRRAFVSGKRRQNTIKTTTFSDGQGHMLLSRVVRPGRMHDQSVVRSEGICEQFRLRPTVKAQVDAGYTGLAKEFPDQVTAPPKKPKADACDGDKYVRRERRRRETYYAETHMAIASLVSDRAANRPTYRPKVVSPSHTRPA